MLALNHCPLQLTASAFHSTNLQLYQPKTGIHSYTRLQIQLNQRSLPQISDIPSLLFRTEYGSRKCLGNFRQENERSS